MSTTTTEKWREHFTEEQMKDILAGRGGRVIEQPNPFVGMSAKAINDWSVVRAVRDIMNTGSVQGLEKDASIAMQQVANRAVDAKGFMIPHDVANPRAALGVSPGSAGGYLSQTTVLPDMIEMLRNKTMTISMGATVLSGLVGNVAIPKQTGGATANWLAAMEPAQPSQPSFGGVSLVPHRLVGTVAYQKELMMQTSLDVERIVRDDIVAVLSLARDAAALFGKGGKEPIGIFNTDGIGFVTFAGSPSWAKVVDFETQVAEANADPMGARMGYITSPAVRGKMKTIPKVGSTVPIFIWETPSAGSPNGSGIVNGYRAEVTNQIPSTGTFANRAVFANWRDLIHADWAGIDVIVDPFTYAKSGLVELTITLWADIGIRHAPAFVISTDSGAQ